MSTGPIIYEWSGEAMVPLPRFHNAVNAAFVVGERYRLDVVEERSGVTHRHYFAALHEAWSNLPEETADRWPSEEHFRKWLLIRAGFRDERTFVASSKAEAVRLAAFMRPMDDFAVVLVSDAVVKVLTAKSQSMRAMGRAEFQDSKQKVLELAASMINVELSQLGERAKVAA